jgi:hypothetical protein
MRHTRSSWPLHAKVAKPHRLANWLTKGVFVVLHRVLGRTGEHEDEENTELIALAALAALGSRVASGRSNADIV